MTYNLYDIKSSYNWILLPVISVNTLHSYKEIKYNNTWLSCLCFLFNFAESIYSFKRQHSNDIRRYTTFATVRIICTGEETQYP